MPMDGILCSNIAEPTSSFRADLLWPSRLGLGNELSNATSDDHNFLIQSPFCLLLDSMEISMSIESNHMPMD